MRKIVLLILMAIGFAANLELSVNAQIATPTPTKPVLPPLSELLKTPTDKPSSPILKPVDNSVWLIPMKAASEKMKQKDYSGAVVSYTECLNAKPVFPCYYGRATAYMAVKKYDLAMADADSGIKLSPEASEMFSLRASLHLIDDDPLAALADLDKAIKFDPENPDYYLDRADINCTFRPNGVSFKALAIQDQKKAKELGGKVLKPCK